MARLYCRSLKRAPSVRTTPWRINQGGQIWHAVISSARPPCLSVFICWYARTFPKLHRTYSGIALAGNTCFKLTGRGWANTAQQLHKGSKIEKSVLSPCQWGSLRGWQGRSLDVFFFFVICQKVRRAHRGAVLLTVSVSEWVWLFLKGIFWEGVFVPGDNEQSEE